MPISNTQAGLICTITAAAAHDTLLVFDKDGVLLDLNSTWLPVIIGMGQYLEDRCQASTKRDALLAAVGVNVAPNTDNGVIAENSVFAAGTFTEMRKIWSALEPKLIPVFADAENYRKDMDAIIATTTRGETVAKGDVKKSLKRLKSMGFKLAVATNDNTTSAMINLEDLGIHQLFDTIICADSGFGRKPQGGGLLEACRRTDIPPQRAIMVGDTATDFLAADNAAYKGFITIADSAPEKPDFIPHNDAVLETIDVLPNLLLG
ncbi:MAG: HAD family hydrolase [Candidatus Puniceispirillales bacterium WSBS_2018_MAG_OTU23]